ncbi:MAG: Gfo/Idh/MocA family oxidoreductase [Cyanobacteria bacterium J06632_3]
MTVRVGVVGTGYAAKARLRSFGEDPRSRVISVAGSNRVRAAELAENYSIAAADSWEALVADTSIDLIVVCTVSNLHGDVVAAALQSDKHVVVEYPLALNFQVAAALVKLAKTRHQLLHVEHIELLGGLHLAMRSHLSSIGDPFYINYRTLNPQHPAPKKWTYQLTQFGFPFCGALSRVNRLTNLFGRVKAVECITRMVEDLENDDYFTSILSSGRLRFESGAIAELTYGKGDQVWIKRRDVEVQGTLGAMTFVGNEGTLITAAGKVPVAVAPRKGLFLKDTQRVLDYLTDGKPLYTCAEESLYALRVAEALRRASESGDTIFLDDVA